MKKFNMKMATTVVICGAFLCSSCIGSFGLHSRLLSWNQNIDDNKCCCTGIYRIMVGRCHNTQFYRILDRVKSYGKHRGC